MCVCACLRAGGRACVCARARSNRLSCARAAPHELYASISLISNLFSSDIRALNPAWPFSGFGAWNVIQKRPMRSSCGLRGGEYIHLVHLTTRLDCLMHIYSHYTSKKEIGKMLWSATRFDQEADAHEAEMNLRLAWIRWLTFNSGKFLMKTLPNCKEY